MLPVRGAVLRRPRAGATRTAAGQSADALLIWCLAVTLGLWLAGWETGREVAVIFGFHLVGLALELWKVDQGSWSYPDTGIAAVGGVPLYSGFM